MSITINHLPLPTQVRRSLAAPASRILATALLGLVAACAATIAIPPAAAYAASTSTQSIVALVNDDPITGYEVEQRIKLALLGTPDIQRALQKRLKSKNINDQFKAFAIKRLKANPPKSEAEQQQRIRQLQQQFVESIKADVMKDFRPKIRKAALDELIEERLKMQEAKRLGVVSGDDEVNRVIKTMAERNKMTPDEFAKHVASMGANISAMRARIQASLSWADVVRRKFGHQIQAAGQGADRFSASLGGTDEIELRIHRILLSVAANNQKQVAERMSQAERIRAQFTGCTNTQTLAAAAGGGARFDDLGVRKPSSIPEPTRSLLLAAGDNEMLPPSIGEGGVELWAVCSRKVIKAAEAKRESAEADLRQKEFEILSKKHLKDLRQDAHIEIR